MLTVSDEVIAEVRSRTDTVMLAFSIGKDSIGAWRESRDHASNGQG